MSVSTARALYATFEIENHYLGIKVLDVQEVLRQQQLTPVPLAPPVIAGLINLRGQIIPAVDMRRLMHLADRVEPEDTLSVVLRTENGPVSLQVDEIGDVLEIEAASVEAPPLTLEPYVRGCLSGVCQLKDRLLLVLDTGRTVDVSAAYAQGGLETNNSTR